MILLASINGLLTCLGREGEVTHIYSNGQEHRAHDSSKSESELSHNYCNQPTGEDQYRLGWFSNPHAWGCRACAGSGACVIYSVALMKPAHRGSSPPGSDGADYQLTFMLMQEALIAARE